MMEVRRNKWTVGDDGRARSCMWREASQEDKMDIVRDLNEVWQSYEQAAALYEDVRRAAGKLAANLERLRGMDMNTASAIWRMKWEDSHGACMGWAETMDSVRDYLTSLKPLPELELPVATTSQTRPWFYTDAWPISRKATPREVATNEVIETFDPPVQHR